VEGGLEVALRRNGAEWLVVLMAVDVIAMAMKLCV
jgi:hypothetical protein